MSQEQAIQFLQQGIAAAKAKQNEQARQLLQNAIRLDPSSETAWLWLSSVAKDNQERAFCLRQILQINPENEMALKGLQAMGVVASSAEAARPAEPASPIPRPAADKIAAAQAALEPLYGDLTAFEDPYSEVNWVHKTRNRAGERAATLFNIGVRVVPVLILLLLVGAAAVFVTQNPDAIAFAPTWTPSFTPTATATPTPGFTPTPSPTPELTYTPTPAIDPGLPHGDLFAEMTITPVYPDFREGRIMQEAVLLMDDGQYSVALPTLSAVREQLIESSDNQNPYYYEAVALTNLGDTERALRVLDEGFVQMEELGGADTSLLHTGMAYVYTKQGDYSAANEEADLALEADSRLRQPYLILAESALADGDFQAAADVITEGLAEHPGDVPLLILRGELNLARDQPAEAQQAARVALYVDPTAEDAYILQAQADMAFGDEGLAVLHLQDYLFIYPGSIEGWTLLGDARALEGNIGQAIDAYSRAVNTEETIPAQIPALLARAELYSKRNQFTQAYEDYSTAVRIAPDHVAARAGRALAAYQAGRYGETIDDIATLLEQDPARADWQLLQARALVDGANPNNEEIYRENLDAALDILAGNFPNGLAESLQPQAYEYRSRILFDEERYRDALGDVEKALTQQESGSRHYWRGRIQEEMGNLDEAQREYEWIQTWGEVYNYSFLVDALARLDEITAENG
ncbi:tetratricopeptide repeat protein [Chloroflexota bacterium]